MPGLQPGFNFMRKRLDCILSLLASSSVGVADIGSDHGYIPITLAKSGYHGNIISTDISFDSLSKAMINARHEDVCESISFRVSDGLDSLNPDDVDTIVIAGMGGDLICSILDRYDWVLSDSYTLILQPMSKAEVLRYWLLNNGFAIDSENLVLENGRIFQIITSSYSGINSKAVSYEYYCGLREYTKDFILYRNNVIHFQNVVVGIIQSLKKSGAESSWEYQYYNSLYKDISDYMSEVNNGSKD